MAKRSDISKTDLLSGEYIVETYINYQSGRYTVLIDRLISYDPNMYRMGDMILPEGPGGKNVRQRMGCVEKKLGRWHVVGGDGKEYRDLFDAMKAVIDSFIDSQNEFDELFKKNEHINV